MAEIERLTVVWDANFQKLDEKLNKISKNHSAAVRRLQDASRRSAGTIEKDVGRAANAHVRAERQIVKSQDGIRRALISSAGALAAGFSVGQVAKLADSYTGFTNQLRLAGLEGVQLASVQEDLFKIAQRFGAPLESLGTLYRRDTQTSKELGASQADLLRFTTWVSAALKVQGGDASASAGALLQLSQALGGGTVRAEEFNSILEGARPIAQAVANGIDRFGGSVSKLRTEVIAGKVTSQEFFNGFLKGSRDLEAQATKANLTIGASFTVLNNALGKYIGEQDKALSATQRVSGAIIAIANNLDTIVPALTVLTLLIGVRYAAAGAIFVRTQLTQTASTVRLALATEAATAANLRLATSGGIATASAARLTAGVSGLAVAQGVALRGATGLAAALGGPVTLAVSALVIAIGYLISKNTESALQAKANQKAHEDLDPVLATIKESLDAAAGASGRLKDQHLAAADAATALATAELTASRKIIAASEARLKALVAERNASRTYSEESEAARVTRANAELNQLEQAKRELAAAQQILVDAGVGRVRGSRGRGTTFVPVAAAQQLANRTTRPTVSGAGPAVTSREFTLPPVVESDTEWTRRGFAQTGLEEMLGIDPNDVQTTAEDIAATLIDAIADDTSGELVKTLNEVARQAERDFRDATYDGIRGGLQAVADGDIIDYLKNRIASALLDSVAGSLTNALLGQRGSDNLIGKALGFAGFFGDGGRIGSGQWGIAGERGPEIVRGPATVSPMNGRGGNERGSLDVVVHVDKSKYFDVHIDRIATARSSAALSGSLRAAPARMDTYRRLEG